MKKNYIIPAQRCVEIEGKELLMQGSIDKSDSNHAMIRMGDDEPVQNTEFDVKGQNSWDVEW